MPVWLPYVRGERTPFEDHSLRSNLYGLDIGTGAEALERAAFEASGFVVRRLLEMAGVKSRRIVASGGGSRVTAWMAAVADATGLPVDTVAVPEGAARGAAYFARMAAGLETSLADSARWAAFSRRIEPDPTWVRADCARASASSSRELGTGRRAQPFGVNATFKAPLRSWRASALRAGHHSSRAKRWVNIGVMSSRPSATGSR